MELKKIKEEHFQNIVAIAYADGILSESENAFLQERAEDYGLLPETVEAILEDARNLKFVIPMNDEDREEQLGDAVYMAMVDGEIHKDEYDLCLKIAEKLDLSSEYLDEVIKLTKKLSGK